MLRNKRSQIYHQQQEEEKHHQEVIKIIRELVEEFGEKQTYHDIKNNKELKAIFLELYEKPKKYHFQRSPSNQ